MRAALRPDANFDAVFVIMSTAAAHAAYRVSDALAEQLVRVVSPYGFTGVSIDYEKHCCDSPSGVCACDDAEAAALAGFVGTLSKTLSAPASLSRSAWTSWAPASSVPNTWSSTLRPEPSARWIWGCTAFGTGPRRGRRIATT
jgi:hypothetical protein